MAGESDLNYNAIAFLLVLGSAWDGKASNSRRMSFARD
jgi:hypothetical protein